MSGSIKLISLNIERSKHLDLVLPFLASQSADVVCLQEVVESDIERLRGAIGATAYAFEPMGKRPKEPPYPAILGVCIFSRWGIASKRVHYYSGEPGVLQDSFQRDASTYNLLNRIVLVCDVKKDADVYRLATTHFRWTPDGQADDDQRQDLQKLLRTLDTLGEFILAGDFNAPRGREIFTVLAKRYKDNVPSEYITSIDGNMHRDGRLDVMVDGVFSTPDYYVSDVEMISGVSDHCAVVATVTKKAG